MAQGGTPRALGTAVRGGCIGLRGADTGGERWTLPMREDEAPVPEGAVISLRLRELVVMQLRGEIQAAYPVFIGVDALTGARRPLAALRSETVRIEGVTPESVLRGSMSVERFVVGRRALVSASGP